MTQLADMRYDDLFKHCQNDNPFGLDAFLSDHPEVQTVVCDSLTAIAFRALQKAVLDTKAGQSRTFTPTMETPGISAYGARNAICLEVITGLLRVTAQHNRHIVITAHEADPTTTTNERGQEVIDYIGVMLGGQLVNNMTWRLSEIWHLSQSGPSQGKRLLAVRPTRLRRPMKTRIFDGRMRPDFELRYDAYQPDDAPGQHTIYDFYHDWLDNQRRNIPVPE